MEHVIYLMVLEQFECNQPPCFEAPGAPAFCVDPSGIGAGTGTVDDGDAASTAAPCAKN
jgi:hypothetical protein